MIRVGIIGTGLIAREHAQAITLVQNVTRLVAAADIDPARLDEFCVVFQVPRRYQAAEDLMADPAVDLVAITTPPVAHEDLVAAALENGKYIFCEKPLAHSPASATRIAEIEARHHGRLTVGYQLRYDPSYRRLLWLCGNGWLGDIQSALVERHSYIPHASLGRGWWGSWKVAGGGVLITQLVHEMDLLLQVMGRPLSVTASMDTRYTEIESEDHVEATIGFENGRTARCVASVNSGRVCGSFTIRGSQGTVGLPWSFTTHEPTLASKAIHELNKALPETCPPSLSLFARGARFAGRRLRVPLKSDLTTHALLYQKIARSIEKGDPLPISPIEAMGSLELCFAAYESALTGREVKYPLNQESSVYGGVLKENYDARKCSLKQPERRASEIVRTNADSRAVRVGLIGLDTSHASSFTSILHNPDDPFHIPGAKVVAAYPGGSADMPISISRVGGFTRELRDKYGVQIVDAPEDVAEACDLIFILSCDGRLHPALFRAVAGCGKPVFIDKPFAVSGSDAEDIFAVASRTGTRVFGSSAFRYADGLVSALDSIRETGERVRGCYIRYWLQIQETQGRYFWYGIHASEMLLAIMGPGVREVEASSGSDCDSITVFHDDGRQSHLLGSIRNGRFQVSIETDRRELNIDLTASIPSISARVLWAVLDVLSEGWFPRLWRATPAGSVSGPRPGRALDPAQGETLEVVRLLDAAQRSYLRRSAVSLDECASTANAR
jgi:predicted dehydrogenase